MLSQTTTSIDHSVKMKSGSTFVSPTSWKVQEFKNHVQLIGPENDLTVFFIELPITTNSLENIVIDAWREVLPDFDLKPSQEISPPTTGNWERMSQIIYDTPTSESRIVMAIVRTFKDQAYLCLIDSKMAGLSRRGAELNIMFETWKPVGFQETELAAYETKNWTEADNQNFEKFVSKAMQKLKIPGAAIAIVGQDGTSIFSRGFGVKQLDLSDPVTINTPFMIGSTTKPFTSFLMAMLVDQGKLAWETPVTDMLTNFSLADLDLTQKLNIRHTVSASTGMPQGGLESLFKYNGIKPEDRLLEMKRMQPTTKIGETFQYSNYLIMAGGYAAARAHIHNGGLEEAYARAMKDFVFDPLQMKNTVIKTEDALQLGAAFPHGLDFNGHLCEIPLNIEKFAYSLAPAGAMWSTVEDLSHYLLTEMNTGVYNGKRIISEECILERRKPGIRMGEKSSYGLGLFLSNDQGFNMVGHGGNTMGFSSDLFFLPEKGVGMVVLTNKYFANSFLSAVKQKFLELSFSIKSRADEMLNFAILQQEEALKKKRESISRESTATAWIEKLIGEYSNSKLGSAKLISAANGEGYELEFKEWKTSLGSEIEKNGNKLLVLIDPPSYGGIKLQIEDNGNSLVLELGQEKEYFNRKPVNEDEPYSEILYAKNRQSSPKQESIRATDKKIN